ncbi:MAG TPA: DUF2171 domain-containing protein [Thermomicrobiaceae bacterium]|nr:DUF2171 domain-containing protein [Thermomicrobiaceae bacterium]
MSIERDRARLRLGMAVEAEDGLPVGRVVALEQSNFIVERPDLPTIAVPYIQIAAIDNGQVRLSEKASEVDKHGYIVPEESFRPLAQQPARPGMEVIGSDGQRVGQVVDVHADYLTVDTGLTTQLYYIPDSAITRVHGDRVELAVPDKVINAMGWNQPPLSGSARAFTVEPGMEVVGSDGDKVGDVDQVRDHYFRVRRSLAPDFFIPYAAVTRVEGQRVVLNVPDEEVHEFGWMAPPVGQQQAAGPGQGRIQAGMTVVSGDGDEVGTVTAANPQEILVDRGTRPDLHVPYGYVRDVLTNRVMLSIPKADIPFMNWEIPVSDTGPQQAQP